MPSPPLAPDDGPIDLDHLARMTLGDAALEREVLAMFLTQSALLMGALATLSAEAPALAHKLKGSARAIGASRVSDCVSALEFALSEAEDPQPSLRELHEAVTEARTAIEAMLQQS